MTKQLLSTGLAIFSMFFGAGNLIYPVIVGLHSGQYTGIGLCGFIITAMLLPLIGLVAMVLYDGDYETFFGQLGKNIGDWCIATCMLIMGPLIAIPRVVTLSHTMIAPFLPWQPLKTISPISSFVFSIFFLGITYIATYRKNNIVAILGNIVSPLLFGSLAIIIIKGLMSPGEFVTIPHIHPFYVFVTNVLRGYQTLDLLSALFFASIIIKILKQTTVTSTKKLAYLCLKAGLLGVFLLMMIYVGVGYLSAYHSTGLVSTNPGELFGLIALRVLGTQGAAITAIAVIMACLSTSIALCAVVGEYIQKKWFQDKINFATALAIVIVASLPLSIYGLSFVLELTGGIIIYVGYPALIALTFVNILHKIIPIKAIKLPILIVLISAFASYFLL